MTIGSANTDDTKTKEKHAKIKLDTVFIFPSILVDLMMPRIVTSGVIAIYNYFNRQGPNEVCP